MVITAGMIQLNISLGISGSEKSILYGMELTIAMEITFSATIHFLPVKMPLGR